MRVTLAPWHRLRVRLAERRLRKSYDHLCFAQGVYLINEMIVEEAKAKLRKASAAND